MTVKNPSPIEILDEGVSQGFVTRTDFTGSGVSVTVSGGVATIIIAGAAGSDSTPPTLISGGATFTVNADRQALFTSTIECDGILAIDGLLTEVV